MCLAAVMVGIGNVAHAQFRQSGYLNLGMPTGSFASKIGTTGVPLTYKEMGKDAHFGFGGGYRVSYRFDVGVGEVAPFLQADLFWNTISGDLKDSYTQARSKHTPAYFNVPIMVGVTYLYDELWNDITPYGEFGLGTDILFISSEGPCSYYDNDLETTVSTNKYSYKPSTAFAFTIGAGAYFGRHFSAGIYYYGLGTHNIEYKNSTYNKLGEEERKLYDSGDVETRTTGMVALRLGFHF